MTEFARLIVTIKSGTPTIIVATDNGIPVVIGAIPKLPVVSIRQAVIDAIEGVITASGGESAGDNPCVNGCIDAWAHSEGAHDI